MKSHVAVLLGLSVFAVVCLTVSESKSCEQVARRICRKRNDKAPCCRLERQLKCLKWNKMDDEAEKYIDLVCRKVNHCAVQTTKMANSRSGHQFGKQRKRISCSGALRRKYL